jgi:hypothetical protein
MYDLKSDFEDLLKSELKADGVIHNVGDTQHYITFDPQFIKSAEPVTYDDFGNIIPIVKRDNFRKIDTNYSKGGKLILINNWRYRKIQTIRPGFIFI